MPFDPLVHYTQNILTILNCIDDIPRDAVFEALKQDSLEPIKGALSPRDLAYNFHRKEWEVRVQMMLYQNSMERRQNWDALPQVETLVFGQTVTGRVIETQDDKLSIEFEDEVEIPIGGNVALSSWFHGRPFRAGRCNLPLGVDHSPPRVNNTRQLIPRGGYFQYV